MKQAQPAPRPRGRPPGMIDDLAKRKKMIDDLPTEPAYEADFFFFFAAALFDKAPRSTVATVT